MQELLPVARANAVAAAGFGLIMALVNWFLPQNNTLVLLGITIAYVLIMNRWVTRVVPPPPQPRPRERKGSFKPEKNPPKPDRWAVVLWTLKVVGVGIAVQTVVFTTTWLLVLTVLRVIFPA